MVASYKIPRVVKDRIERRDPAMLRSSACWLLSGAHQVSEAKNEREVAAVKDESRQAADSDATIASFFEAVADDTLDARFLRIWETFGFSKENLAENKVPDWLEISQKCSLSQLFTAVHADALDRGFHFESRATMCYPDGAECGFGNIKGLRYVLRGPNAKRPGDPHAGEPCLDAVRLYQADVIGFLTNDLPKLYKDPKLRVVVAVKHRATRFVCVPLEDGLSVDLKSATCADGLKLSTYSAAERKSAWSSVRFNHDPDADPLIGTDPRAVRGRYVREALDEESLQKTPFAAYRDNALTRAMADARSGAQFGDCEALLSCHSTEDAIVNCLKPTRGAIIHLLDEGGTHHLLAGCFLAFATYEKNDPDGMLGETVKWYTGATWVEPLFKFFKEKCGLAPNAVDWRILEWKSVPDRDEYARVVHDKLVSIVRDGGVEDIEAYIDEIRKLSETHEAFALLTAASRPVARESLEAGRPYEFPQCECGSKFHPSPAYRWCRLHMTDADVVVDWPKYFSLGSRVLMALPESLRIAPGGGLADTLRLLCRKLGLPDDGRPQTDCAQRLAAHFRVNTPPVPYIGPETLVGPYPIDEEALRKLKRLHDDGIIDDDEFRQGKAKALGITPNNGPAASAVSAAPAAAPLRPLAQVVLDLAGLTPEGDYTTAKPLPALRWEHSVVTAERVDMRRRPVARQVVTPKLVLQLFAPRSAREGTSLTVPVAPAVGADDTGFKRLRRHALCSGPDPRSDDEAEFAAIDAASATTPRAPSAVAPRPAAASFLAPAASLAPADTIMAAAASITVENFDELDLDFELDAPLGGGCRPSELTSGTNADEWTIAATRSRALSRAQQELEDSDDSSEASAAPLADDDGGLLATAPEAPPTAAAPFVVPALAPHNAPGLLETVPEQGATRQRGPPPVPFGHQRCPICRDQILAGETALDEHYAVCRGIF